MSIDDTSSNIAVNAAFLREIKEDNRRLREMLGEVRQALAHAEVVENHPRRTAQQLAELRDQIAIHFALEEAYGYFDDAVRFAPRFSAQAARLKAQHPVLFTQLNELVELAEDPVEPHGPWSEKICSCFTEFDTHLRGHEQAEEQLILDVFESDIGGGD